MCLGCGAGGGCEEEPQSERETREGGDREIKKGKGRERKREKGREGEGRREYRGWRDKTEDRERYRLRVSEGCTRRPTCNIGLSGFINVYVFCICGSPLVS